MYNVGVKREYKKSRDCNLYSRRISPYKFQHEIKKIEEDDTKTYYYDRAEKRRGRKETEKPKIKFKGMLAVKIIKFSVLSADGGAKGSA